jgi:hypothetical protein
MPTTERTKESIVMYKRRATHRAANPSFLFLGEAGWVAGEEEKEAEDGE